MVFKNLFKRSRKESEALKIAVIQKLGRAEFSPRDYESFAKEGYQKNVIAYTCITDIAQLCAEIPLLLYKRQRNGKSIEITEHPLLDLLRRPSPLVSGYAFIESVVGFNLISGNSFIESVMFKQLPCELYSQRPDRFKILPGRAGIPKAYVYQVGSDKKIFDVDFVNPKKVPILHLKRFHPTNDWFGLSPMEAAAYGIDQHNESGKLNMSLLQNRATPSGTFEVQVGEYNQKGILTEEQYKRLKKEIREQYQGTLNAGTPMLLEGGMKWTSMGLSPIDMDWINGKQTSARDICRALKYPSMILGIPGDNRHSNYTEAKMSLYEQSVFPTMRMITDGFNNWLTPQYGEGLYLEADKDSVSAFAEKRNKVWDRAKTADHLTLNEKRDMTGYEPVENGDVVFIQGSQVPLDFAVDYDEPDPIIEDENDDDKKNREVKIFNLESNKQKQNYIKRQTKQRKRLERKFALQVNAVFKKEIGDIANGVDGLDARMAEFVVSDVLSDSRKDMQLVFKANYRQIMNVFGSEVLGDAKSFGSFETKDASDQFLQFVSMWLNTKLNERLNYIYSTTRKKLIKIIKDAQITAYDEGETSLQLAKRIKESFKGISKSRSVLIARTETTISSMQGSLGAAKVVSKQGIQLDKEWLSALDERTRDGANDQGKPIADHLHMNGIKVGIDELFTVKGTSADVKMSGPGDPSAPVEQVANCRCSLIYHRRKQA